MVERPKMLNERSNNSPFAKVMSALASLLIILLCAFFVYRIWFNHNYFVVEVVGSSMEQTTFDGDRIYAKRGHSAQRGDVIIIDVTKYDGFSFSGDLIIKRLIACGGDTVKCENGVVSVKYKGKEAFTALTEPYAYGETSDFAEKTVGEGEIFFLGDNRGDSYDSRFVGCFLVEDIIGVVPEWAIRHKHEKSNNKNIAEVQNG